MEMKMSLYSAAIFLVHKLSVRGHLKTRTAPSRELAHEQNRRAALYYFVYGDIPGSFSLVEWPFSKDIFHLQTPWSDIKDTYLDAL